MGYIIEISESKVEHLADNISKMLHFGGMAMSCIEEMRSGHGYMGERGNYGNMGERSGGYGRYGMREPEMPHPDGYDRMGERVPPVWHENPYMIGERQYHNPVTGRYMHR